MASPNKSGRVVTVTAPSRLHFGMLSFGRRDVRQFGGAGVMIQRPAVRLQVASAEQFDVAGVDHQRARSFAKRLCQSSLLDGPPACRIEVLEAPRGHTGLGSGTQLAMAVGAGLLAWCGVPQPEPQRLAASLGRGGRSAVGTYGFAQGGLLVEAGKRAGESISPLVGRFEVPRAWRFVLLTPSAGEGLSGNVEQQAFDQLPSVPPATTDALCRELLFEMLPSLHAADFAAFSESLYRYGLIAGECFASVQGGPFATPRTAELVAWLRSQGVAGVGQSSWGPTLFALTPNQTAADELVERIRRREDGNRSDLLVTPVSPQGAQVEIHERS